MTLINLDQTKVAELVEAKITRQVQERLDSFAQTKDYDSVFTCLTYENDPNPTFASDAATMKQLRSDTWTACHDILAEVKAETRPLPSDISDIEADLPVLAW